MKTLYDIIIVGGGPAGLSAAITARARNKSVVIISNSARENPLAASKLVDNYPGMPSATGLHILETMAEQAHQLGVESLHARAISIVPMQKGGSSSGSSESKETKGQESSTTSFSVTTSSDYIEGKSVIITCGAASGGKTYEGEIEYLGRGVSYCATCDGMLHRNSKVLVVGLSAEAVDEAGFLAEIGATVHFLAKKAPSNLDERIRVHRGTLHSIEGDALGVTQAVLTERPADSLQGTQQELKTTENIRDKPNELALKVNAVFILRPGVAPTSLLSSLELEGGYIKVDAEMRTNIEGVFAAGDCTGKPLQVAKAVGQGQIAVLSAVEYLASTKQ